MSRKYHFPLRDEVHLGEVKNGLKCEIYKINIFFSKIVWEIVVGWLVLGSLVSKDGRSDISQIPMPSPYPTAGLCPKTLHLDLVIPLPEGDSIQVLPAVSLIGSTTLPTELPGKGKGNCGVIQFVFLPVRWACASC